jgi:uncharacterized protein
LNNISAGELGRTLLGIQDLDTRITARKKENEGLADKHRLAELRSQVVGAQADLGACEQGLEELEHRQHKLDGELDLLDTKVKKEEEKLFSGTIMNPKELSSIQAEILSLRKKRDEMETEDLEEMEDIDRIRSDIKRAREALAAAEAEEREQLAAYTVERSDMEQEVKVLQEERDDQKGLVDEETIEQYESLLKKKGGQAVVRIEQGRHCGGCHIEFSRTQIDRFQHEDDVFRCEHCRRILVK